MNETKISGHVLSSILIPVSLGIIVLSILITHIFHFYPRLNLSFYLHFSLAAFLFIPLISGLFGIISYARNRKEVGLGNLAILTFSFGGFGLACGNIHDVIWCAKATNLYTQFNAGGHDLLLWVKTLNVPSYDYRIFGTYMLVQVIVLLAMGHVTLYKFMELNKTEKNFTPLKLNWLAMVFLTLAIVLIDWPWLISPPILLTLIISVAIMVSIFIFYYSGTNLSKICTKSAEQNREAK